MTTKPFAEIENAPGDATCVSAASSPFGADQPGTPPWPASARPRAGDGTAALPRLVARARAEGRTFRLTVRDGLVEGYYGLGPGRRAVRVADSGKDVIDAVLVALDERVTWRCS